jgi:tetratricopeptide (TPR) repeat protein
VLVETGGVGFLFFFLSFFGFLRRLKAPPLWEGWGVMTGAASLLLFSLVDLPFQMPEIVWWVAAILGRLELKAARVPNLPSLPALWAQWGLLTVLLISGFWPPFRPWNFALLAGTFWVLLALSRAAFEKLPLWVFAGGAFLALRAFTSPSASGAVRFLETAGLVLAFYLWLPGLENPKAFLKRFLLLGVIWGIEAWVFSSLGYPFENWTGFPNPKHLAVFLIPLFFVFFDFPSQAFRWSRLLASLFVLATLVRLRATGALLGLAGGTFFHPGLSKTRKMLFAGVLILGALGVHALQKSSTQWDRGMIWKTSLQVWGLHPFFGSGPGVFAGEFHKVKEPIPGGISRYLMDAEYSHNEPLDFLAAFGLAGMAFLMGLAGAGWRKNRTKEKPAEGRQAARAGLAGMGVGSFLDFCFHTPLVVLQAAGLLAREKRQTKGSSGTAAFLTLGIVGGLFGSAAFVPHLREQAKELEAGQKFPEALRRLEAAERLNAWDARPAWEKARFLEKLYLATGDTTWRRKADEALARAMDLERAGGEGAWDKARLLTARALRDRSGESFRAAVQAWDGAAKALPYSAFLQSEEGTFFLQTGQKEGALQCFQKAVDLEPNDAGAWVNVGNLRRERGEEKGAKEACRRAWEIYNQWKGAEGISPLEKQLVDLPPPVLEILRKETGS